MRRVPTLLAVVLAGLPVGAGADTVRKNAPATPDGEVEISNTAGLVEVETWSRSEVEVEADLGRGVERLDLESEGRRTRIRVILENGRGSGGTDLRVKIPEQSRLSVTTVSADIRAGGVRGTQRLQGVSGEIDTESWGEDVELRTVSGDVRLKGHGEKAVVTVTTVSGDVMLEEIAGELVAATVSGDLLVRAGELTRMKLQTTNGDMSVRAALAENARADVETINGDLGLEFGSPLDAEFDVESFTGEINNCFGPKAQRVSRYAPGRELRFTEGSGSARVRIKSLNGDIDLCTD